MSIFTQGQLHVKQSYEDVFVQPMTDLDLSDLCPKIRIGSVALNRQGHQPDQAPWTEEDEMKASVEGDTVFGFAISRQPDIADLRSHQSRD